MTSAKHRVKFADLCSSREQLSQISITICMTNIKCWNYKLKLTKCRVHLESFSVIRVSLAKYEFLMPRDDFNLFAFDSNTFVKAAR